LRGTAHIGLRSGIQINPLRLICILFNHNILNILTLRLDYRFTLIDWCHLVSLKPTQIQNWKGTYSIVAHGASARSQARQYVSVSCATFNHLDSKGNYSATSNNTKLVHWSLVAGLLHLVQREGPGRTAALPSPPINSQCTNHRTILWSVALLF